MKLVVLIKQVPEVAEMTLDPETGRLVREGIPTLINPFDRRAVLEAMRLREEVPGSTVTVVTMGPPQAESALRDCLGLGVDRVVLLSDRAFAGADTLATARALARALERVEYDVVLAGRYTIDSETGQVPPEVAALLGAHFVPGVRKLSIEPDTERPLVVQLEGDDGATDARASVPAVLTCTDRWKSRVPRILPDEERAASAPVETWSAAELGGTLSEYGQEGSPTWVASVEPVEIVRDREKISAEDGVDGAVRAILDKIEAARSASAGSEEHSLGGRREGSLEGGILVVGERAYDGSMRGVSWELLGAADRLAQELDARVGAMIFEPALPAGQEALRTRRTVGDELAAELGARGADVLVDPFPGAVGVGSGALVRALEAAIQAFSPRIVLAPATSLGRDLVPQVAARLGLGLTGDAIGLELDADGRLRQLKPAFGGQVVAPILSHTAPEMATVRPGMLPRPPKRDDRGAVAVAPFECEAGTTDGVELTSFEPEVSVDGAALDEAETIVCAGFGLGGPEMVEEAQALASKLGGVVGATRRVCDLGWAARQLQIGLSGKSVSPRVFLAFGVRGSFNHTVGIQRAGTVIGVNSNPDAEIFSVADLGIVGDGPELLRALSAALDREG